MSSIQRKKGGSNWSVSLTCLVLVTDDMFIMVPGSKHGLILIVYSSWQTLKTVIEEHPTLSPQCLTLGLWMSRKVANGHRRQYIGI